MKKVRQPISINRHIPVWPFDLDCVKSLRVGKFCFAICRNTFAPEKKRVHTSVMCLGAFDFRGGITGTSNIFPSTIISGVRKATAGQIASIK